MTPPTAQTFHDALARQLTDSQKKAVFHTEGPLLVIAGPGSGKTRVITCRIAALIDSGVPPHNICAITFTNKAADEMRQRAIALGASGGAHISTFHSLCVRILRRYAQQAALNPNFSIYDSADQAKCAKDAIKDCDLDAANFTPGRMLEAISTLKNKLIDPAAFKQQADDYFSKTLAKIYARYQDILKEHNALDFDDLLMNAAFLLERDTDVLTELSNRFRFLLIDEYQDTNHAQYRIARALASTHNNICATGDPDQSIYRWRGADIRNILAFERDWPDATVVKLEENFRSTPNILEAADRLIAHNLKRKEKSLVPTKKPGEDIVVRQFDDEADEAKGVARQVKALVRNGVSFNEIAVFYRINAQSRALEESLITGRVPYQIVRGVEFYNRKEIRDILAYLKVIVNPADQIALLRIINNPPRGLGKTTIDKVRDYASRRSITLYEALKNSGSIDAVPNAAKTKLTAFFNMIENFKKQAVLNSSAGENGKSKIENNKSGVSPFIERIFKESGLEKSLKEQGADGKDALENIDELINAAALYDRQSDTPSLTEYLQQISLFSDVDVYDPACKRVALMTLHCAKGLEFDNVFIVGVEEGLLPHEHSVDQDDEIEEERRLFFVGITRAKSTLHISHARYRTIRGQLLRTIPSQFLFELDLNLSESSDTHDAIRTTQDDFGDIPHFRKGQIVVHKKFGLGTVRDFVDMGDDSVVTVSFNTGHTKTLATKYAKLTKI
jgi:DNA helicase-2/ATP-dependent DNA helicase PcrA